MFGNWGTPPFPHTQTQKKERQNVKKGGNSHFLKYKYVIGYMQPTIWGINVS